MPIDDRIQALCAEGQELLEQTEYHRAADALVQAEAICFERSDYDSLSRLYMPLQEARRQIRQRCGEGIVRLDLLAAGPTDVIEPAQVLQKYPHGQLLIAGWAGTASAQRFREAVYARRSFVETFLSAVYPVIDGNAPGRAVVIAPLSDTPLPPDVPRTLVQLQQAAAGGCVVIDGTELPAGEQRGTPQTYAAVMALWERLHRPLLEAADRIDDLHARIQAYRRVIEVDYACELAHQKLSAAAREIARRARS